MSAGTDFIIASGTALTAAMVAKGDAMLPSWPVIILSAVGGLIAFASGEEGRFTRVLCRLFGSAFTYAYAREIKRSRHTREQP